MIVVHDAESGVIVTVEAEADGETESWWLVFDSGKFILPSVQAVIGWIVE